MPYADPAVAAQKARERYLRNRETIIAAAAQWARDNPERRVAIVKKHRAKPEAKRREHERYLRDREERIEKASARNKVDPRRREIASASARRNPETGRRSEASRRARKRGQFVEHVDSLIVLERDDGACGICGGDVDPTDFHVDHVVPLARGGEHSYSNVQAAHPRCNLIKGG